MRNPAACLLIPTALLLLAACGQTGPLVHPDKNAAPAAASTAVTVTPPAAATTGEAGDKNKDKDAPKPAVAPSKASPTP